MTDGLTDGDWLRENPQHPGTHIKLGYLDACDDYPGLTMAAAAKKLGVSVITLSRIVNGHRPVTVEMAMKLEAAGWDVADNWLAYQARYDIAQARKRLKQPLAAAPARQQAERTMTESRTA